MKDHQGNEIRTHGTNAGYIRGCRCRECTTASAEYRRRGLDRLDPRHGTLNGYKNCGCRCNACREAHRQAMAKTRKTLKSRPTGDVPHGTPGGYENWGCRCGDCTEAHRLADSRFWRTR